MTPMSTADFPVLRVVVTFDGHPPSENVVRGMHWAKRQETARNWRTASRFLASQQRVEGMPWDKATLRIVWLCKLDRRRDLDGIVGACKPLIDGLVDAGLIRDDDSKTLVDISASVEQAERDGVRLELSRA